MGADYDGIDALPDNLPSVAEYPNLTAELLRRGYTHEELALILGGNILRVMEENEATARRLQVHEGYMCAC